MRNWLQKHKKTQLSSSQIIYAVIQVYVEDPLVDKRISVLPKPE